MTKKKEIKKKVNIKEVHGSMKGVFPEDRETTEIVEKVRTEWANKLAYGSS